MVVTVISTQLQQVEDDDGAGDEQGLTRLDAIDACKDVDGIGAEYCQHSHVDVVENTHVQVQPEQGSEGLGHHYDCVAEVGKIDHEQRQGSHGGKQELVSPPQVEHVVGKAQEDHATDGQEGTNQLYKLIVWEARALIPHKAAKERHWDEAEEDDEEDRPTDHSLRLWDFLFGCLV